ncbi:MAG: hypothetical protein ACJAQT_004995 [Akkermansiaceae bacterium]
MSVAFFDGIPFGATHQGSHDFGGLFIGPIREDEDVVLGGFYLFTASWGDDDRSIKALLLLESSVAVIPVGAGMAEGESEGSTGSGFNGRGREVGDAVFGIRDEEAVPVNGGFVVFERVVNSKDGGVAFSEAEGGTGDATVDSEGGSRFSGEGKFGLSDGEVVGDFAGGDGSDE